MEEELKNLYRKIEHSEKNLRISYRGNNLEEKDISIDLSFRPDFLSQFKTHQLELYPDFEDESIEFGGIINYNGNSYIRRINFNLSKEALYWSTNNGMQFYLPAKNPKSELEQDSQLVDHESGEMLTEYFTVDDFLVEIHKRLGTLFNEYKLDQRIVLYKNDLVLTIWPTKEGRLF